MSETVNRRAFGRRRFLIGASAAGAGLTLPWLETFSGRGQAQTVTPPLRFVLVSAGHSFHSTGADPDWIPTTAGALTLPTMLAPLAPFRNRITTVRGIDNLVTRLVSSNGHNASSRTLMTCMPHAEGIAADGSFRADAPALNHASTAGGPSIEYAMASALGGAPVVLRVGGRNLEHRRTFRGDATDDYGEPNPVRAFERIFGAPMAPELTPLERLARRRATILGTVAETHRTLASRLSAADRTRLESHAALIESVVADIGRTVEIVCDDPALARDPGYPSAASAFENPDGRDDLAIARTQNNLVAAALACTTARVVSLHYSNIETNRFPWLNGGVDYLTAGWHAVTHRDAGTDEQRMRIMSWYFEIVADLLGKLADVADGEGRTLLDNTIVLFTTSLGNHWHGTDDIPVVIASDPAGYFRTERHFAYTGGARRSLADLWVTVLNAMGVPATTFGWNRGVDPNESRAFNRGPLMEILRG